MIGEIDFRGIGGLFLGLWGLFEVVEVVLEGFGFVKGECGGVWDVLGSEVLEVEGWRSENRV